MDKNRHRVTHLSNAYTEEKLRQENFHRRKKRGLRRRLTAISVIGFGSLALLGIPIYQMQAQQSKLNDKLSQEQEELAQLEQDQKELEYHISLLENEEYVAKLARSEYYVTKDNEIVFSFPGDETPTHQEIVEETE